MAKADQEPTIREALEEIADQYERFPQLKRLMGKQIIELVEQGAVSIDDAEEFIFARTVRKYLRNGT